MNAISDIQAGKGLTRALAEQARALRLNDIPEPIRQWARQCVLDYARLRDRRRVRRTGNDPAGGNAGAGRQRNRLRPRACRPVAGGIGGDRQRRGVACAGLRRREPGDAGTSLGRHPAGLAGAGRGTRLVRRRRADRVRCGIRTAMPYRQDHRARSLRWAGIPRDRHGRQFRRRRRVRASAAAWTRNNSPPRSASPEPRRPG